MEFAAGFVLAAIFVLTPSQLVWGALIVTLLGLAVALPRNVQPKGMVLAEANLKIRQLIRGSIRYCLGLYHSPCRFAVICAPFLKNVNLYGKVLNATG
jgi:hypothetical protein